MVWQGLIHQYREFLPVSEATPVVTLNEGNTPLILADRLRQRLGLTCEVYLKYEGANPTGSFKDRGMTLAMSKAVERGARAVICASTGNTSASAAAYAARAGLQAFVLIPEGKIALGKLSQAMIHGARVLQIRGNFDDARAMDHGGASHRSGKLVEPGSPGGPEDGGLRGLRPAWRCADLPLYSCGKRREHHGLLAWVSGIPPSG